MKSTRQRKFSSAKIIQDEVFEISLLISSTDDGTKDKTEVGGGKEGMLLKFQYSSSASNEKLKMREIISSPGH